MEQKGNSPRDWQRAEALLRMKKLDIREDVIRQFSENGTVMVCGQSDGNFIAPDEELAAMICKSEETRGWLVYLALRADTALGRLDSLLYVSKYPDEWKSEMDDLVEGYPMTYTINRPYTNCSELGSINIMRTGNGGVIRAG